MPYFYIFTCTLYSMEEKKENIAIFATVFILLLVARILATSEWLIIYLEEYNSSLKLKALLLAARFIPVIFLDYILFPLLINYFVISFLKPSAVVFYNILMSYLITVYLVLLLFVITKNIETIDYDNNYYYFAIPCLITIISIFLLLLPDKKPNSNQSTF